MVDFYKFYDIISESAIALKFTRKVRDKRLGNLQSISPEEVFESCAEFLNFFGIPQGLPPADLLEAIAPLDPRNSAGTHKERYELMRNSHADEDMRLQVFKPVAARLYMLDEQTPLEGHWDLIGVLGGANKANHVRLQYGADALKSGKASCDLITMLCSIRPLKPQEQEATNTLVPNAKTEVDLCRAAAGSILIPDQGIPETTRTTMCVTYEETAGTPRVIEHYLEELIAQGMVLEGKSFAVITTQIYAASTVLDLRRIAARFGITLTFVAGTPSDRKVIEDRSSDIYRAEIVRTLRAAIHTIQEAAQAA